MQPNGLPNFTKTLSRRQVSYALHFFIFPLIANEIFTIVSNAHIISSSLLAIWDFLISSLRSFHVACSPSTCLTFLFYFFNAAYAHVWFWGGRKERLKASEKLLLLWFSTWELCIFFMERLGHAHETAHNIKPAIELPTRICSNHSTTKAPIEPGSEITALIISQTDAKECFKSRIF